MTSCLVREGLCSAVPVTQSPQAVRMNTSLQGAVGRPSVQLEEADQLSKHATIFIDMSKRLQQEVLLASQVCIL